MEIYVKMGQKARNCYVKSVNCLHEHLQIIKSRLKAHRKSVLLKFGSLNDLERYIKLIYYNEVQHETSYFQVHFMSVNCLHEHLQIIKSRLKAHRKSVTQMPKYNENPELKRFKNKMPKHLSAGSRIFRIFQKDSKKETVSSSKFVNFSKAESFKRQI